MLKQKTKSKIKNKNKFPSILVEKPKVLVLTGYGINCDEETKFALAFDKPAFDNAGADVEIVHINDLIDKRKNLQDYKILVFPGGFSYGDDTGSGNALANKIRNNLWEELMKFVTSDKLVLGICNGFQVLVNLGLLPALDRQYDKRQVALNHNDTARYECRWVDIRVNTDRCVFTKGIKILHLPVAHGEGKFHADDATLFLLDQRLMTAFLYVKPTGRDPSIMDKAQKKFSELFLYEHAKGEFPFNPNGSLKDIAGICDQTGRILGMMPHPERAIHFTQLDNWTYLKELKRRKGIDLHPEKNNLKIFKNAVDYFKIYSKNKK
jgi:phosphoribosylformylglycinamidine synthase